MSQQGLKVKIEGLGSTTVAIQLTHLWRMEFPIVIIWISPLSFFGAAGAIFHFYFIFR